MKGKGTRRVPQGEIGMLERYWPLGIVAVLTLTAWVPYMIRGGLPESTIQFTANSQQVTKTPDGRVTPFSDGHPASFNVNLTNQGPKDVLDCSWRAQIRLIPAPNSLTNEDDAWKEFEDTVPWTSPRDLTVNQTLFKTYRTAPLTATQIDDLRNGKLLFYVFAEGKYRDGNGNHVANLCEFVEPPTDNPTWVYCQNHNLNR